jgi:outer membrane assembly lipoprotein YfiO
LVGVLLLLACSSSFKLNRFPTNESLFTAGVSEFRQRRWDNAIQAFEKLTVELSVRDTLLPYAHFYLAEAHERRGEHLLAAQEFLRLAESFATDSLADDAQYLAGKAYQRMWRRPSLDAQYGGEAQVAYQTLLNLYPDSPLADSANKQLGVLDEMFARKDYETGMHYFRRKAYDSAVIYFRSILDRHPRTNTVRDASVRLAQIYDRLKYKEDKSEVCTQLQQRYPNDREVRSVCGPVTTARSPAKPDTL